MSIWYNVVIAVTHTVKYVITAGILAKKSTETTLYNTEMINGYRIKTDVLLTNH